MLNDEQLNQIDAKEFRRKIGISKADYRFVRNMALAGMSIEGWTIYSQRDDGQLTLHQFIKKLRDIDVLYVTRDQKERRPSDEWAEGRFGNYPTLRS